MHVSPTYIYSELHNFERIYESLTPTAFAELIGDSRHFITWKHHKHKLIEYGGSLNGFIAMNLFTGKRATKSVINLMPTFGLGCYLWEIKFHLPKLFHTKFSTCGCHRTIPLVLTTKRFFDWPSPPSNLPNIINWPGTSFRTLISIKWFSLSRWPWSLIRGLLKHCFWKWIFSGLSNSRVALSWLWNRTDRKREG